MKNVSNDFISAIKKYGKQYECTIEQYQYGRLATEDEKDILTEDDLHYVATESLNASNYILISNEEIYEINPITNGNLLRSNMKCTNFKTTHQIRVGTRVRFNFILQVNNTTETITSDFYYVAEREYDEATGIWSYVSYDAMLFSEIEYSTLQHGTFPMTVKDYLTKIGQDLGFTFSNNSFPNYDVTITKDPYANLGYTYREILDELSAVTGGSIGVRNNTTSQTNLEIIYPNNNDINKRNFDEEWFKNINVKFAKKYGPINSLVLSRVDESDNIYRKDQASIDANGLCELKIVDNQIMNGNDRDNFIDNLFNQLKGTEYYINDFESPGIAYMDYLDYYNCTIDGYTYKCLLLNDELTLNGGMSEHIFTEEPEESVTDYTKASSTDRKIKRAYIIVDKQQGEIEANAQRISLVAEEVQDITNENYLINSNFATGDYRSWNEQGTATIRTVLVNATYHKNWLRIQNTNATINSVGVTQTINREIPANTKFTLSFLAVYGNIQNSIVRIGLGWWNGSTAISSEWKNVTTKSDPDTYTMQFTSPNSKITGFTLAVVGPDQTTYDFAITDIKFEVGNVATEWCPNVADHIKTSINLSPESVQISANNISLAGKNIALTSDNISISSTNFGVTNAGVITAKSGTVGGWNITDGKIYGGDGTNLKTVVMQVPQDNNYWVFASGGTSHSSYADCPFRVSKLGELFATKGQISGITIDTSGLYSSGTGNYEGFGLWKYGIHPNENDYIIFHAGGNTSHIGDAKFRIYSNGKLITKNSIYCYPDQGSSQVISICTQANRDAGKEYDRRTYMTPQGLIANYDTHTAGIWVDDTHSHIEGEESYFKAMYLVNSNGGADELIRSDSSQINLQAGSGVAVLNRQGTSYTSIEASAFIQSSSKRYKENIKDLENTDLIMQLRPVKFDYKKDSRMQGQNIVGLIAEEVEKLDKSLISYKEIDGKQVPDGIDYSKIVPYLIKQVQDQQNEIDELKAQIQEIKEMIKNGK